MRSLTKVACLFPLCSGRLNFLVQTFNGRSLKATTAQNCRQGGKMTDLGKLHMFINHFACLIVGRILHISINGLSKKKGPNIARLNSKYPSITFNLAFQVVLTSVQVIFVVDTVETYNCIYYEYYLNRR